MLHLKTLFIKYPTLINLSATIIASLLAYMQVIIIDNINMFVAIFWVELLDFVFGVILAIKRHEFKTRKAIKIVYYLSTYWAILFVVLSIEKAHPAAYWASEGIVLPILIFQIISALKNAAEIGLIPNGLLKEILKSIDKHKNRAIEDAGNILTNATNENGQDIITTDTDTASVDKKES